MESPTESLLTDYMDQLKLTGLNRAKFSTIDLDMHLHR